MLKDGRFPVTQQGDRTAMALLTGDVARIVKKGFSAWLSGVTLADLTELPEDLRKKIHEIAFQEVVNKKGAKKRSNTSVDHPHGGGEEHREPARRTPEKRIPTKTRRKMSRAAADQIREYFEGVRGKRARLELRDNIAREKGYTRRQVSAAVSGLKRVAKRKKVKRGKNKKK